jgi:hypothetical protein
MEPVKKVVVPVQTAAQIVAPAKLEPIIFTSSEIKSGLWKNLTCTLDGKPSTSGDLLMTLFVLNNDADKALLAAKDVLAVEKDIRDNAAFMITCAKPLMDKTGVMQTVAYRIALPLTGAEVKAHAHSIVALSKTARPFAQYGKILEKSEKASPAKGQKGNRTAGLVG